MGEQTTDDGVNMVLMCMTIVHDVACIGLVKRGAIGPEKR